MSLMRFSSPEVEEFIDEMAGHFTRYIFESMETDIDDDIPMERIKEEIFKKGKDSLDEKTKKLLIMFCNAEHLMEDFEQRRKVEEDKI